jgi:hypothetical protein
MTPPVAPTPVYITMSLLDVMTQMYRMAGVLKAAGRGMSPSQQQEGLVIVNAALDGIKTERFFFYQILRTQFNVTNGKKSYTVGDASFNADWVVERPEKLLSAGIIVPPGSMGSITQSEIPIYVVLSYEEYQSIVTKDSPSTVPLIIYYQASLPVGTATLWPVPSADQVNQVVLYTPQTVQEFTDVGADFIVPKGYREFLMYDGAIKVHDRYPEFPMDPHVRIAAQGYRDRVKMQQQTPLFMRSDPAVLTPAVIYPSYIFNGRTLIP